MPRVVLTISNTGDRRAVLTGMVFTVRDYVELRPCQGRGAATLLDGEYQVRLPVPARHGQSIGLDLDRDVRRAASTGSRCALRFLSKRSTSVASSCTSLTSLPGCRRWRGLSGSE